MRKLMILFALCLSSNVWSDIWSSPVNLDNPPSSYLAEGVIPQIEVDAAGNAFAAWCSTEDGNTVWAARYDVLAQSWGPTEQIGIGNAENAVLSVTADGKAIVVWDRDSVIYYNSYVAGWRGEAALDPLGGPSQIHARIGVNGNDSAIAVWTTPAGPTGDVIRGGFYDFATDSWSIVDITTSSPDFFVGQPEIAVSSSSSTKAIAVWRYRDEGSDDFRIQYSVYTTSWSAVGDIATQSGMTANQLIVPIVAISNDGSTAIANWMQTNHAAPFTDYYVMGSVYTGSWSTPIQLSPNQSHLTISGGLGAEKGLPFYSIAFDGAGDAVNLWSFADEGLSTPEYKIQARTYQNAIWSSAQDISGTNDFLPQIALDASGNGWAVWNKGNFVSPPINIIATPFIKAGNIWGSQQIISTSTFNFLGNVATNAVGDFFSVWVDGSISGIIQASNLIQTVSPLPPRNFSGVVKTTCCLGKIEYLLAAKWDKSLSTNVVFYRIYKGSESIGIVLANTPLLFVICIDSREDAENYTIVAVDSDNNESTPIRISIVTEETIL